MTEIKIDKIVRSKRKTVGLQIAPDATLTVRAPLNLSLEDIRKIILKKRSWIWNTQEKVKKTIQFAEPKKFVNGEEFFYLGNACKVELVDNQKQPLIFTDRFQLSSKHTPKAKELFIAWYKIQAHQIIAERVNLYCATFGLKYKQLKITSAQRRWGSCTVRGGLNFSWRLVMSPLSVIDYVVVHELAHTLEHNHSKAFWRQVERILPDYKKHRKWLKDNGRLLNF